MAIIKCTTPATNAAAVKHSGAEIWRVGDGEFVVPGVADVRGADLTIVTAWGGADVHASCGAVLRVMSPDVRYSAVKPAVVILHAAAKSRGKGGHRIDLTKAKARRRAK